MDWKDNIGEYLVGKGIFRLDYLNTNLNQVCDEWLTYLNEFKGIQAYRMDTKYREDIPRPSSLLVVSFKNTGEFFPFKIFITYKLHDNSNKMCLYMRSTSVLHDIIETLGLKREDEAHYKWIEEELVDPEIFEKGYILQLLNYRLKRYYENSTTC
jgi:hypothetical protein